MTRRFAYMSFGILCLVAAYQLGAEKAAADWDPSAPGQIVGVWSGVAFTANGEAWTFWTAIEGWQRDPAHDLPLPASQVKFIDQGSIISTSDVAWRYTATGWDEVGPFPGGPISVRPESWGKVKAAHR